MPDSCAATQRDLNRLKKWAVRNLNLLYCEVPDLVRNNSKHQYMLGATQLESSLARKDLEVLVDTMLNMNQECALLAKAVNDILGCTGQSMSSRPREVIFSLY